MPSKMKLKDCSDSVIITGKKTDLLTVPKKWGSIVMRFYNNPLIAIAYFLGMGGKTAHNRLQNAIDKRDKVKESESLISYRSADEEERKRRCDILEKREKRAMLCLLIALCEPIILIIITAILPDDALDLPPGLALLIIILAVAPMISSIIYGLWFSLYGKYL